MTTHTDAVIAPLRARIDRQDKTIARLRANLARLRAAAMIAVDEADAEVADCCGREAEPIFCESYGCTSLTELVEPLRAALAQEEADGG